MSRQRRKEGSSYQHLSASELQIIASHAYKAFEKVLFYKIKPHKMQFRSKFNLKASYRNRVNTEATRLVKSNKKDIAYRSLSEERKKLQGQLINRIVSQAAIIKIEELNVKGLQKRSRDIRINPKTNRPFSKKRFGKAIFRAAPSAFKNTLQTRAHQLGIDFEVISPKNTKPSQYNHITQTFEKKPLSTRMYDLSEEYPGVQRDLYSAFLIKHIEKEHYQQEQLEQDFPVFYKLMKDFLQQKPKTKHLAWYLS